MTRDDDDIDALLADLRAQAERMRAWAWTLLCCALALGALWVVAGR